MSRIVINTVTWAPGDSERDYYFCNSLLEAQLFICSKILEQISSWDMTNFALASAAQSLNSEIKSKNYKDAIFFWNEDYNLYCNGVNANGMGNPYPSRKWHTIIYHDVGTIDASVIKTLDDSFFTALLPKEETNSENISDIEYKAIDPGATCRGPCGQYNEYAYANKKDGTFVCKSCQMMSQVFGGTIK